jgi:hypothetical protein
MHNINPAQYIAEMRRLEGQRNAARRLGDLNTLKAVVVRETDLNRQFWRRPQG